MDTIKRNWPALFIVVPLIIAAILTVLKGAAASVITDIVAGTYDERRFYYWSLYYREWYWLIIPLAFLILLVIWLRKRPNVYPLLRPVLIVLGIGSALAIVWLVISNAPANPEHLGSIQISDKAYHLDAIYVDDDDDRYVLYACDLWGLRCHAVYTHVGTINETFDEMQLLGDPFKRPTEISLQVDGEIVYTFLR